jgi:hypothetical protein
MHNTEIFDGVSQDVVEQKEQNTSQWQRDKCESTKTLLICFATLQAASEILHPTLPTPKRWHHLRNQLP